MKKLIVMLGFMAMFVTFANAADSATCRVPGTDGYVTAYNDGGIIYVSNDTDKRVTVTIVYCNGNKTISVSSGDTTIAVAGVSAGCTVTSVKNPICE